MIIVTREEADRIKEKVKGVHITRTCRFKHKADRGKYYAEPTKPVLRIVADMRECDPNDIY